MKNVLILSFLITFLLGCAASAPKSSDQLIASGYITIESLAEATKTAYDAGYIDTETKQLLKHKLLRAFTALNAAEKVYNSDMSPEEQLATASKLLNEIAEELQRYDK